MDKKAQFHIWYFVAAMFAILLLQNVIATYTQVESITYSQFQSLLRAGKVDDLVVTETMITGKLKDDSGKTFVTPRVDPTVAAELDKAGVGYTGGTENTLLRSILSWLAPALIFFGLWMFVFRKFAEKQGLGGGFMTVGRSKAKIFVETDTKVTFDDVAGVDEAKAELIEIVNFLKEPKRYGRLGARIPKGILLVGPPGTGKTLLARAVAGQAGVPFFSISARNSSNSSSASAPRGCAISSSRQGRKRRRSSSSTNSMLSAAPAAPIRWRAPMTRRSRPSISCWPNSTVSIPALGWCCWPPPIGRRSSIRPCSGPGASTGRCCWIGPTRSAGCRS
jgi:hypothetical protein